MHSLIAWTAWHIGRTGGVSGGGGDLISLLIYLVVVGLIFWAVSWFVDYAGIPAPFNKIIRVVLGLVALIFIVNLLLGLVN